MPFCCKWHNDLIQKTSCESTNFRGEQVWQGNRPERSGVSSPNWCQERHVCLDAGSLRGFFKRIEETKRSLA